MKAPPLIRPIGGLLLAGGRSRRFGAEKAMAPLGGAPMMHRTMTVFARLPHVAVSARAGSGAEQCARQFGLQVLHDDPALPEGPLSGILSGLAWARRSGLAYLASAPCDAPLLPADLVTRLAAHIGDAPAAFAVTHAGQHPLCALWSVHLHDTLSRALHQGEHPAVRAFLPACGAVEVEFDNAHAFLNANTPDALAGLEQRA